MSLAPAPGVPSPSQPYDPGLDFFSRAFEPLRALLTEGLQPPVPAARPQDNVLRCRFMLPADHPEAWREPQRAGKSKEAQEAAAREKQRLSYLQQKKEQQQLKTNPLDQIAERIHDGPLLLLKRCYQRRSRVRVVTRHARGVRGTSEGVLVAFDKHMNLVLRDVEEQYTVLLRVQKVRPPAPGGDGTERTRWARQQEHRRRQLRQVFVRGDSVVLVAELAAARPAAGAHTAAAAAAGGAAAAQAVGAAASARAAAAAAAASARAATAAAAPRRIEGKRR